MFFTCFGFFKNLLRGGPGTTKDKKKNKKMKKKRKKNEKKRKKLEVFYDFGFLKNLLKIGHFGGLHASLGGRAGNPPKWKLWGAFPYKNLCKGNFGAARSSKMESLGNLSNFGDDFGDVFGDK